jgi:hypothetical protein
MTHYPVLFPRQGPAELRRQLAESAIRRDLRRPAECARPERQTRKERT